MAEIKVTDLTFSYEDSADTILDGISFHIDTDWKLGFIGRNGKGKTTMLRLLMGDYSYQGSITTSVRFDYFPYPIREEDMEKTASELIPDWKPEIEEWQVLIQMNQIKMDPECLYRPFGTLSYGERTRVIWTGRPERSFVNIWRERRDSSWYPMTGICWMQLRTMCW